MIHYENRHFIIDLNRNKLTYIFPLLNYVTRQVLIEIDKDTLGNIRTNHINENKKMYWEVWEQVSVSCLVL
ncbi:DUF443 family protein [Staphylococcus warneri]|uniref:DUF443 family protein n=1 Tax=Staphylococcus warneri TaxID=1292 RepID=UPI002929CF79|nr:DUF443 family protein [Staphylococcus warneri]MDU9352044.1 DUF443 family protein [Staphylococcus warneri]